MKSQTIFKQNKLVTANKMRELERAVFDKGLSCAVLMEEAACGVTNYITSTFDTSKKIAIVCGSGNNGGDGYAVARQLFCRNYNVTIIQATGKPKTHDSIANYNLAKTLGIIISEDLSILNNCDVIVDAILGTGIKGDVEIDAISAINNSNAYKLAIDIPSGICSDTGVVCKNAVKADATITFGYKKTGLALYPGAYYAGKVVLFPISVENFDAEFVEPSIEMIATQLPHSLPDAHKGDMGKLLVIAGSTGMTGAAHLSCLGALRSGCGLVSLAIPENLNSIMETKLTEAMTIPLNCNDVITFKAFEKININAFDAILIGPGLGKSNEINEIIKHILKTDIPIIIDADGINSIATNIDILKDSKASVILTPHPMEFSRLSGLSANVIQKNRLFSAQKFAKEYNVTLVLKGAGSVIASPTGQCVINNTGNCGMATGGSGDVLSGIIGALAARKISPDLAATIGVYVHGLAGDIAAQKLGFDGMLPSDLTLCLPEAMQRIRNLK